MVSEGESPDGGSAEAPNLAGSTGTTGGGTSQASTSGPNGETSHTSESASEREKADSGRLEAEIRSIATSHPGTYGVVVWQPGSGKRVSVNAERSFQSGSIAKLPVFMALYRDTAAGRVDLGERIRMSPSDVRPGTGVLKDRQPPVTLTLRRYAYHLISDSDNTAWTVLHEYLGRPRIRAEIVSVGATPTHYEYANHSTTPQDVLKMLESISDPGYTSPELSREMLSFMTDTSFEDRLAQEVPPEARLAHKIGILGDTFADAGVVYPEGEREEHYYIVVFSEGANRGASRSAMQEMSSAAYESLVR